MFPSVLFPEVFFPSVFFPHDDGGGLEPALFDEDLQSYLSAQLGQTIYPLYRPQPIALPSFTYTLLSLDRTHTLGGRSGLVTAEYQLSCWSTSYLGAKQMATALRNALDSFSGLMGATTVRGAINTDEHVQYNPPVNATDKGTFHRACMYTFIYIEP